MSLRDDAFWPQWRHLLLHASPLYWTVQALVVVMTVAVSAVVWLPHDAAGITGTGTGVRILRTLSDGLLIILVPHLGLRAVLRVMFVSRQRPARDWLLLGAWIVVLGVVATALSYLISAHLIGDGLNVNRIHFSSEESEFSMELSGLPVYLLGVLNMSMTFALWGLLYLAYKAFQARRQLQAQLREARMRQLTHQLNPHFLFNAFNSIRGMIFEDRERAAELVTQLSELFRHHLSHEMRTEQTLAEEWELARRYLDVEGVRLESRLRLSTDLAEDCLDRRLPTLTVLGLVENAIKHGIAPNPAGGELRLRARREGERWWLEVDNSIGPGRAGHGTGSGLGNLRERLALGFGPRARMTVGEGDGRFTVRLELPA